MDLTPGTVIAGRYRIDAKVGAGGMGEVWAGEHVTVGSRVALKTLLPAAALNHEVVARFRREAYFLGQIRSEHVSRVVDFVEDPAVGLVLVMEFVDGEPLSKILQTRRLSVEEGIDLGIDIASALRDLHGVKIIHRDLKPGNIIIQPRPGGASRAVIVDFGVSRAVSGGSEDEEMTGITRADMAVGTIEYMAPEQILNSRDVIAASDIYAVGAILYRALMGHHIFGDLYDAELAKCKLMTDPPPLRTGRQDRVALGFEKCVGKAIKRRPKERYDQAERILADLIILRDLARVASLELDETTHEVTGASIPIVITDPVSTITQARISQPGLAPAPAPSRSSAPGPPPASGPAQARAEQDEPSVTRASAAPLQRNGSSGSLTASEALAPEPPPRRRGISGAAAALLAVAALVGGAGLGSTWTQRKLAEGAALVQGAAAPAETVAAIAATAEPTAAAAAEPAPAPAAEATAAPAAEAAATAAPTSAPAVPAKTTVAALSPGAASTAPTGARTQTWAPKPPSTPTSAAAAPASAPSAPATAPAPASQPASAPTATFTAVPKPAAAPKQTSAPKATSAPTPAPVEPSDP